MITYKINFPEINFCKLPGNFNFDLDFFREVGIIKNVEIGGLFTMTTKNLSQKDLSTASKAAKIGLVISLTLAILSFVSVIGGILYTMQGGFPLVRIFYYSLTAIMLVMVLVYTISAYKTPHGNLLRYTFLIFGVLMQMLSSGLLVLPSKGTTFYYFQAASMGAVALLSVYIGGRLNKIRKNKPLMIITGILLLVSDVGRLIVTKGEFADFDFIFKLLPILGNLSMIFAWNVMCYAYLYRYQEHKNAGLTE